MTMKPQYYSQEIYIKGNSSSIFIIIGFTKTTQPLRPNTKLNS